MNGHRDLDRIVGAWLTEGPAELADRVLDAALDEIHLTHQRPHRGRPWRVSRMTSTRTWILGVAAAAAVVVAGTLVLSATRPSSDVGGTQPPPSASAGVSIPSQAVNASIPAVAASVATSGISTADWTAFSSARYGYDIRHPVLWSGVQSTRQWVMSTDQPNFLSPAADQFRGQDLHLPTGMDQFFAFAVDLPAGTTRDQWVASYFGPDSKGSPSPCLRQQSNYGPVDVQGHEAVLWTEPHTASSCGGTYAFLTVGNRLYSFTMGGPGHEDVLIALLSTVQFRT